MKNETTGAKRDTENVDLLHEPLSLEFLIDILQDLLHILACFGSIFSFNICKDDATTRTKELDSEAFDGNILRSFYIPIDRLFRHSCFDGAVYQLTQSWVQFNVWSTSCCFLLYQTLRTCFAMLPFFASVAAFT